MQVTPSYINQPKNPQGKYGNIKLPDNSVLWVPRTHLGWFQQGQPADVELETQKWGNMGEVPVVHMINGHSIKTNALAPAPAPVAPPQGTTGPPPAPMPQQSTVAPPAAPVPPDMAREHASVEDKKSESIFITGVVQQAMATGNFGALDIATLTQAATQAWKYRYGSPTVGMVPQGPDGRPIPPDPDDKIPL